MIIQKNYLRLMIIILLCIMVYVISLNLAAFKLGLTTNRFWIIKDYLFTLFFILGTLEFIIGRKELWVETKANYKNHFFLILFFAVTYLLGGITTGLLIVGE